MNNHNDNYNNTPAHPLAGSAYRNLRDDTEASVRFVLEAVSKLVTVKASEFETECIEAVQRFSEEVKVGLSSRAYAVWREKQANSQSLPTLSRIIATFGKWSRALDVSDGCIEPNQAWLWRGHSGSKFSPEECLAALRTWLCTLQFRREGLTGFLISDGDENARLAIPPQSQAYRYWARDRDVSERVPLTPEVLAGHLGGSWLRALREANEDSNHDPLVRAVLAEELKPRDAKRDTALVLLAEAITKSNCRTVRQFDDWVAAEAARTNDPHRMAWLVTHTGRRISGLFPTWNQAIALAAASEEGLASADQATRRRATAAVVLCCLEIDRRPTRREYEIWRELKSPAEHERLPTTNTIRRCFDQWADVLTAALGGEFDA